MKESTRNLLVGAFVILSLGALATLMVWFGETPGWLRTSEWELSITGVRNLGGIGDGSSVKLNGVEIGRVKRLEFVKADRPDLGVNIVAGIQKIYAVPTGATARVYGATLGFGAGHIAIIVEPDVAGMPVPRDGTATISGEMRSMIGELISKDMLSSLERTITHIGNLTAEWTPVGTNLAALLEERSVAQVDASDTARQQVQPNLATVIERLDGLVEHLNEVLGDEDVKEDVKDVVKDVKQASTELKELVELWRSESQKLADGLNGGVQRLEGNLDQSFANLNGILEKLDSTARSLAVVLRSVEEAEGTAGLLARDPRLYEAAVVSLERFGEVMLNLQIISGKIRDDGYVTVGQAPLGFPRKNIPVGVQAAQAE